jgi:hypothetical protein
MRRMRCGFGICTAVSAGDHNLARARENRLGVGIGCIALKEIQVAESLGRGVSFRHKQSVNEEAATLAASQVVLSRLP